jgi:hypothetical protein
MKIGIVGPAERAAAWEKHLRRHPSVSEVVLTAALNEMDTVDACLLLDDSPQRPDRLLQSIKSGWHTFFISSLPIDQAFAKQVHYTAEEANVQVQFSHWPTLAPASQWMTRQLAKPSFIQITRNLTHTHFSEKDLTFTDLWIGELAYCLKYMDAAVYHTDANISKLQSGTPYGIHIFLRFDRGSTAALFISTCASVNNHRRFISDHHTVIDCNVEEQTVRLGRESDDNLLFFEKKTFDPTRAAEKSVARFIRSIQLKEATLYNSYDLLRLTKVVEQIKARL